MPMIIVLSIVSNTSTVWYTRSLVVVSDSNSNSTINSVQIRLLCDMPIVVLSDANSFTTVYDISIATVRYTNRNGSTVRYQQLYCTIPVFLVPNTNINTNKSTIPYQSYCHCTINQQTRLRCINRSFSDRFVPSCFFMHLLISYQQSTCPIRLLLQ